MSNHKVTLVPCLSQTGAGASSVHLKTVTVVKQNLFAQIIWTNRLAVVKDVHKLEWVLVAT